ncbi:DUF1553 domain-containing protein [Isosphaeraceae bacterium EP7]
MQDRVLGWGLILGLAAFAGSPEVAHAGDEAGLAFFESKIRPVLVRECYACHAEGAKSIKGGLRVDSRRALIEGGDSGPAIVPGQVDEGSMLAAIRHEGPEMPPKTKLSTAVVEDFRRWIEMGAPDPRESGTVEAKRPGINLEAGRQFWAYRPPEDRPSPSVRDEAWPLGDVDRFVLAKLEAAGLPPASEACPETLIRRLTFDLAGLPPTPEEVAEFAADDRPGAYERAVDRLLASPRFGERWGRHWLDVARFGESQTLRGLVMKEAWRYRDFVIDAFNRDMPFDQFLREQVAGDLIGGNTLADRRRGRVATTFLALGNTNLEEQDKGQLRMDVVDEQIDVIGKAVLGQTIACARCHDHKFDPIPTKDYYAIAGILRNTKTLEHANVSKWLERPLPETPDVEAKLARHEAALASLESRIKSSKAALAASGKGSVKGVVAAGSLPGIVLDDIGAKKVGNWSGSTHSGTYIGAGYLHDDNAGKGAKSVTFQPELPAAGEYEVRLAYAPGGSRAGRVPVTILNVEGETIVHVDMRATPAVDGRFSSLGRFRFEKGNQAYVLVSNEGTTGHVTVDAVAFLPAGLKPESSGPDPDSAALDALEAELKRLRAEGPRREMAMAVVEESEIADTRVHVRGNVHTLGDPAPRGFLQVASAGEPPGFSASESGRRELADWLASGENPLTARVYVNRAWQWLFGAGLVPTPDNFGTTGEPPSHPELLDHLAIEFMHDGWSTKALVRRLVLSKAYRLSSAVSDAATAIDPENRLLGRANRRRLEAECLRDAMLAASGSLDPVMGGPGFGADLAADYGFKGEGERRSVYVPVFRNALPELFELFDFADPSMVVGRRETSTVAPQALFLLNHPFVLEQSERTARRLLNGPEADDLGRLDRGFKLTLGRRPTDEERVILLRFLGESGGDRLRAWSIVIQGLFGSLDFRDLD